MSSLLAVNSQIIQYHRARLLAAAAIVTINVVPISACGLRLKDEAVQVGVGLSFCAKICQPRHYICGFSVYTRGSHALFCKCNSGRSQPHHFINDLVWRALLKAGFPSIIEPNGLIRSDNKRSDGLTIIPWQDGRCATWDVTVTDTVAPPTLACHLPVQPLRLKWRPDAKRRNILKYTATLSQCIRDVRSYQPDRYRLHFCSGPSNFIHY